MPAATYGTYNPEALIGALANQRDMIKAGYDQYPAEAQTQADYWGLESDRQQALYGQELAAQHEFAKQQLAQQLTEARWKAQAEAKDPTVLQIMANDPSSPLAGLDVNVLGDLISRARTGQDVTNIQHLGTGMNQLSQGGFDPSSLGQQYGLNLGPYAGPALVQAARIRAAAEMAKAGASGGERISYTEPPNLDAGGVTLSHTLPKGITNQQAHDIITQRHGAPSIQANTSGGTNLPPAQRDTGSGGAPAKAQGQGNQAVFDRVRQAVEDARAKGQLSQADYNDAVAGYKKNGGNPIIKDGKLYGASGKQLSQ